ncbi:MAG TPA: MFS transporter, partial [Nitrososphaerales archaeon]|nr:MFS transporter [Nitrososphaerales archaeon]
MKAVYSIFASKTVRVFVFGIVSIMTPVYIAALGYSPLYVGFALAAIIAGNIFSNIMLTWYGSRIGIRRLLLLFSLLMVASGIILSATTYFPLMLIACFIGNISTAGTEAGPFQSIETGILPEFVPMNRIGRAFGAYNLIGYAASSVGALAASLPSYFGNSINVFHYLYLFYGLAGLALFFLYSSLGKLEAITRSKVRLKNASMSQRARKDITNLSVLYSIDGFGGGFVSQSLMSYWFFLVYHQSLADLGIIFLVSNLITAVSLYGAPLLAEKFGNLKTMVATHLVSNVFLIAIPLAGSLITALTFFFLRQSISQMDVPTRQTFMIQVFESDERVTANAVTNTVRSVGTFFGGPISGVLFAAGLLSIPML